MIDSDRKMKSACWGTKQKDVVDVIDIMDERDCTFIFFYSIEDLQLNDRLTRDAPLAERVATIEDEL